MSGGVCTWRQQTKSAVHSILPNKGRFLVKASVSRLLDRCYPVSHEGKRAKDGTRPLYEWITSSAGANSTVLNIGAGPTPEENRRLRGRFKCLVGVDPDPAVLGNRDLDYAFVTDGVRLPFRDCCFDAAYSDWTIEHVSEPLPFLREIFRVLKCGGSFWFRTGNMRHYVTMLSAVTPQSIHRLVSNRVRALPEKSHEPYKAHYRMNTPKTARMLLNRVGFGDCEIRMIESHPSYLAFGAPFFLVGVAYERVVNRHECMSAFRQIMLCRGTKPADAARSPGGGV